MSKRQREIDDDYQEAVQELESAIHMSRDKLTRIDRVIELVSPSDELYSAQLALIRADVVHPLVELLADSNDAVAVKAAEAIRVMTQLSAVAIARLSAGPLIGLENSVSKVLLPTVCQQTFIDYNVIETLVPWLLTGNTFKRREALETLTALCAYNHDGKLAYLTALTSAFNSGQLQAMEHIDALLDTMECTSDDVDVVLQQLHMPLFNAISDSSNTTNQLSALNILATVCTKRSDAADGYIENQAVKKVVACLLFGSILVKDAATRALHALSTREGGRGILKEENGMLGCNASSVIEQLKLLIAEAAAEEEEQKEADERKRTSDDEDDAGGYQNGVFGVDREQDKVEVCYGDEAAELINMLKKQNPDLQVDDGEITRRASCCIM